ncbi:MAG: 16S rRNA (cytosine(1402)-N(4))-methyltransferase RsmH [Bacteroidales bacterium]|nr:16S rRNA (cytosine(1402)-N(4))-methyltransferase RsmH [Bacteroidales bacterium]
MIIKKIMYHKPVLLKEAIEGLNIKSGGIYVDVTFGGGGHSAEILKKLKKGKLIAFDQDEDAQKNKIEDEKFILIKQNFRYMKNFLRLYNSLPVDGIIADLGISSHQIDSAERGFSFRYDGALDLRMDKQSALNAKKVINDYSEENLKNIFFEYGEIKESSRLAKAIVQSRKNKTINKVDELKSIIGFLAPKGKENTFFAKVFQALRIEVNNELGALKELLLQSVDVLKTGGRLAVISYHSLEDRLVKNFIKTGNFEGELKKDFYGNPVLLFDAINKKVIQPGETEIMNNNRARSAKLRIAEKI